MFFGACLSSIYRKISVSSDSSALFKSVFNDSLFNSLWNIWLSVFVVLILNDFWFLFFVENFHNHNDHFLEIWYACFYGKRRVLKTSWTICKKKIYAWWIIRVFETCLFFNKVKKVVNITKIIQYWIQTLNTEISWKHNVIILVNVCVSTFAETV